MLTRSEEIKVLWTGPLGNWVSWKEEIWPKMLNRVIVKLSCWVYGAIICSLPHKLRWPLEVNCFSSFHSERIPKVFPELFYSVLRWIWMNDCLTCRLLIFVSNLMFDRERRHELKKPFFLLYFSLSFDNSNIDSDIFPSILASVCFLCTTAGWMVWYFRKRNPTWYSFVSNGKILGPLF